jgi:hypothetical protein
MRGIVPHLRCPIASVVVIVWPEIRLDERATKDIVHVVGPLTKDDLIFI